MKKPRTSGAFCLLCSNLFLNEIFKLLFGKHGLTGHHLSILICTGY